MRIGLDCRLAGRQHAGIGRYIQNLLLRLPVLAPEIEWVYFFHDAAQAENVIRESFTSLKRAPELRFAPIRHYSVAEQLQLPGILVAAKLDLLHVPHFNVPLRYRGKFVVTIHDLLWHEYQGLQVTTLPVWQYWLKHLGYRYVTKQAILRSQRVLVPSQTIKNVVAHYFPNIAKKVDITPEGIEDFTIDKSGRLPEKLRKLVAAAHSEHHSVLVYVGSLYPHKNIPVVIDALQKLPQTELWLIGTRNVFQENVRKYVVDQKRESQVKFLGYINDQDLAILYRSVTALVQPSLSEGFGLTGLEAMASELPVLASDTAIFREIYQNGALFFDPKNADAFVERFQDLLQMRADTKKTHLDRAKNIAQQYSWEKMAAQTLKIYRDAV